MRPADPTKRHFERITTRQAAEYLNVGVVEGFKVDLRRSVWILQADPVATAISPGFVNKGRFALHVNAMRSSLNRCRQTSLTSRKERNSVNIGRNVNQVLVTSKPSKEPSGSRRDTSGTVVREDVRGTLARDGD